MKHKFSFLFVSLLTVLLASTPIMVTTVSAAPEHYRVPVDQTQTLSVCGFPILRHDEGMLIFLKMRSFQTGASPLQTPQTINP